jgi:hypothetical protein
MGGGSSLVTAAGWLGIAQGAVMALLGLLLLGAFFSGRGSLSGMFYILSLGAGPLLTAAGVAIVVAGFKLMGGHTWARTVLQVFSWITLCTSIFWIVYSASQKRNLYFEDVFEGAIFLLITGAPAIAMILLLRRALAR